LYVNFEFSERAYWWYSVTVGAKCNTHTHTQTHWHTHTDTSANFVWFWQFPINMSFHCLKFSTAPTAVAFYKNNFSLFSEFYWSQSVWSFIGWERKREREEFDHIQTTVASISLF